MTGIYEAQVFFVISAVGFVTLWILVGILLFYLIRASRTFDRILNKAEKDIDRLGDMTKEMLDDVRDSTVYNFLFRKKRKKTK